MNVQLRAPPHQSHVPPLLHHLCQQTKEGAQNPRPPVAWHGPHAERIGEERSGEVVGGGGLLAEPSVLK